MCSPCGELCSVRPEPKDLSVTGYPKGSSASKVGAGASRTLFKRPDGTIVLKPRRDIGPGEETGYNIRDLWGDRGHR